MNVEQLRNDLVRDVTGKLWAVYHNETNAPFLIWPSARDSSTRISEQESKILITQWLQQNGHFYSIETPTIQKYQQSGTYSLSGRIDVTVYSARDQSARALNVELKAGTSADESFRKDFEKLIREGVPGLWLHTLTNASASTWRTIEDRICRAFAAVSEHAVTALHTINFAFCVLETRQLVEFALDFGTDWQAELRNSIRLACRSDSFRMSGPRSLASIEFGDVTRYKPAQALQPERRFGPGVLKQLVLLPTLEPTTVVHMSTRGASYKLRYFNEDRASAPWKAPGCATLSDLLRVHPPAHITNVASDARSVSETAYWMERVGALNEQLKLG